MNYFIKKAKKTIFLSLSISLLAAVMIVGCQKAEEPTTIATDVNDGIYVITTISILADIASNIVGDVGKVEYIVPVGDNPEDYELIPSDLSRINAADILFVNGFGLEEMMISALGNISTSNVVHVTDGVPTIPLVDSSDPDPHAWFNPLLVTLYAENMYQAILQLDPGNADTYRANMESYIADLTALNEYIIESANVIPEKHRIIVMNENAMKYFGDAYGFQTEGIWELNSHEEGTPQQIARIINIIKDNDVPAIFTETTIDSRYMDMISRETAVPIAGSLYTDALGAPGTNADTYITMMRRNVELLIEGLQ